jgi:hypothetical protein
MERFESYSVDGIFEVQKYLADPNYYNPDHHRKIIQTVIEKVKVLAYCEPRHK